MLNDQLYQFYNLDFRIFMTSHENDLYNITKSFIELIFFVMSLYKQLITNLSQPLAWRVEKGIPATSIALF